MRIERYFTGENHDPYAGIKWHHISIEICHESPQERLCIPQFEVPGHWSREAAEHLAHHYARRTGVPAASIPIAEEGVPEWLQRSAPDQEALNGMPAFARYGSEQSLRQIIHRLVGAWTYWGWNSGYFDTEADARAFYDENCYLIVHQRAMPASPQWASTGLHWAYGIEGDAQGSVYVDAESGELNLSPNAFERPQHHHCFIQGVKDALSGEGGITDLWQREMRVFKHGSASGCNLSAIRGEEESLSNGMRPAGLLPFLEIGEKTAHTLASCGAGGELASKLSLIDDDHPDLLTVVRSKLAQHRQRIASQLGIEKQRIMHQRLHFALRSYQGSDEERFDPSHNIRLAQEIRSLGKSGIPLSMLHAHLDELRACDGEYRQYGERQYPDPAGEAGMARIGFRLSHDFMRAASSDTEWPLKRRVDGQQSQQLRASDMLDELAYFNWQTQNGAIQFSDHILFWHGCKAAEPVRASSPGGEFIFLDNSACDIAVLNLASLVDEQGNLAIAAFEHTVRLQAIMCDIAITMAQFPSAEIAYNTYRYRPIGLSFCNLAAMLMAMGYAYDSAEGRAIAAAVAALMTGKGYVTSAEIARELGGFEAFSDMRDGMMQLMWQHHEAAFGRTQHLGTKDTCPPLLDHAVLPDSELSDAVQRVWDLAMIQGDEFGYSNAQISLVAASPNIMMLMDALAPGAQPVRHFARGSVAGRRAMAQGLKQLDYSPEHIAAITAYVFGRNFGLNGPSINSQTLMGRGFTETELTLIEDALNAGQCIHSAFDPLHLGERFCREVLHLSDAQLYDASFKLLYHLGFDDDEVAEFEQHFAGHGTAENAPFLRPEDVGIFALVDRQSDVSASIGVEAQIRMIAAIQPYISGGIAHRIGVPENTPAHQHRRWMMMAWQLGLKQLDLRREQPQKNMADLLIQEDTWRAFPQEKITESSDSIHPLAHLPQRLQPKLVIQRSVIAGMCYYNLAQNTESAQRSLPARRFGYVQEAQINGVFIRHRTEEFADGSPGQIFLEMPDIEAGLAHALQQQAALLSIALQHGVPLSAFARLLGSEGKGTPHGRVEGHAVITHANSALDYVLQDLLAHYPAVCRSEVLASSIEREVAQWMQAQEVADSVAAMQAAAASTMAEPAIPADSNHAVCSDIAALSS